MRGTHCGHLLLQLVLASLVALQGRLKALLLLREVGVRFELDQATVQDWGQRQKDEHSDGSTPQYLLLH